MWYYLFNDKNECISSQENITFSPLADKYYVLTDTHQYLDLAYVHNVGGNISFDIPLDVFKERRKEHFLKNVRNEEELRPVTYNGYRWDVDEKSLQRINGAIIALGDNGTIAWTSADDETIEGVTANILRGVIGAVAERSNTLHNKYRELRDRLAQAKTIEEARTVAWSN